MRDILSHVHVAYVIAKAALRRHLAQAVETTLKESALSLGTRLIERPQFKGSE